MKFVKYTVFAIFSAVLMGCASAPENPNVPVEDVRDGQPGASGEISKQSPYIGNSPPMLPGNNPAVISLVDRAERQRQAGDNVAAAQTLERAIRIAPRHGELYYRLSEVRFAQQNFTQSEQLCRKAISLSAGNAPLLERSRILLAKAQQAQGAN